MHTKLPVPPRFRVSDSSCAATSPRARASESYCAAASPSLKVSESSCEAAGLRIDRRKALHSRQTNNKKVKSCFGTKPDGPLHISAPATTDGPQESAAVGLHLDTHGAVHIGHAPGRVDGVPWPYNTKVRSCRGTVPNRSTCLA